MSTFPGNATFGEVYGPAMAITDQAEADAYLARIVEHALSANKSLTSDAAADLVRSNLGYYAGYDKQRDSRPRGAAVQMRAPDLWLDCGAR